MLNSAIPEELRLRLVQYQRDELTGQLVYSRLAKWEKNPHNKAVLSRIASDEGDHAAIWRRHTGEAGSVQRWKAFLYTILGYVFGFTFAVKLMEREENLAVSEYEALSQYIPEARAIMEQEEKHEAELEAMLDEERLRYVGAIVLGLNDALVELTGTIAGLTFALQNNRVVALAGIVTGMAATLSMAASNYLAERADGKTDAIKSSAYTGVAYLVTVVILVLPYLLLPERMYITALVVMLLFVVGIIFLFNFYVSIAKEEPLWPRFREMACISLGVAVISFVIGLIAKSILGVDL